MAVRVMPAAPALLYQLCKHLLSVASIFPIKALQYVPLRRPMWILLTYVCFFLYIQYVYVFRKEKMSVCICVSAVRSICH